MIRKLLAGAAFVMLTSSASAQTGLGTANSFNVFLFGTGTANAGEAEGAIAAGGTLSLSGYNTTIRSNEAASIGGLTKMDGSKGTLGNISIYAGGNFNYSSVNVNNGGSAFVHGRLNPGNKSDFNGGGKLYNDALIGQPGVYPTGYNYAVDPKVFSSQQAFSLSQTAKISADATKVGAQFHVVDQNSWTFDASTQKGSLKYVSVDAAKLNALNGTNLQLLNLKDTDTLVIDVTGNRLSQTAFSLVNVSHDKHYANVLWNFASTASGAEVDISQRAFEGSLLAPSALVDQNQLFEGNLIANNWVGHGYEDHLSTELKFNGTLGATNAVTPEGDSLFMVLGGLLPVAGIGVWKRRRQGKQA